MLDNLIQYGGATTTPITRQPVFGKHLLGQLLRSSAPGYSWTKGTHLYSELRPVEGLRITESNEAAQKYLKVIEAYAHAGVVAAKLFHFELFELQNHVLHFHKEGSSVEATALDALRFSYVFTKVLYETFAEYLENEWHGFAICMDHGDSLVVRHGQSSNASTVSLGPSACSCAKRLLYGKTPAGCAEIPGAWVPQLFGKTCRDPWFALNLRDRQYLSVLDATENAELEMELRRAIVDYQRKQLLRNRQAAPFSLIEANTLIDQGNFSTERPLRMRAMGMFPDLDGFTPIVKAGFEKGEEAVEAIAKGFLKILEFGDHFEKANYGVVRLPWRGDCVPFLIPPQGAIDAFRGRDWIAFVEEWQTFAAETTEGRKQQWGAVFKNVAWAVGVSYAEDGYCLVAPVETESRRFLIAAGAPLAIASDAQNLGKGGQTIIHSSDYQSAYPIVRKLFTKIPDSQFWSARDITLKKVRDAAIDAGQSETASGIQIIEKAKTIAVPVPRPYCA